jgi:hypothetical protein
MRDFATAPLLSRCVSPLMQNWKWQIETQAGSDPIPQGLANNVVTAPSPAWVDTIREVQVEGIVGTVDDKAGPSVSCV